MKTDHTELMRANGIDIQIMSANAAYSTLVDKLVEDNARLWKMIVKAQEASNKAGFIGMVGSPAWVAQIKKEVH